MEKCTLVQWPESQTCMQCEHGVFILSGEDDDSRIGSSAYLCFAAKKKQDDECLENIIAEGETPEDYKEEY